MDEARLAGSGMRRSPDDTTFRSPTVSGRSLATLSNPSKMRLEYTAEGVEGKSACNERKMMQEEDAMVVGRAVNIDTYLYEVHGGAWKRFVDER